LTPRIGLVFAHPDDETFCVGGIVAKYAAAGVKIDLFCATDGDAGKAAGVPVSSREDLAAIRRKEARAAADVLGIDAIAFAGYGDGAIEQADQTKLVGDIVTFLRRHKPDVVIGFGPEGAPTGHRDHKAMARATLAAFFLTPLKSAYANDRFEPHTAARLFFHAWEFPLRDPRLKLESVPSTCSIDVRAFRDRKEAAFKAHATQQGSSHAFYDAALVDFEQLAFAAGVAQPRAMIDDVFDGLSIAER
jgi:LmbE family N-acetylglucosaminyl deacetylase